MLGIPPPTPPSAPLFALQCPGKRTKFFPFNTQAHEQPKLTRIVYVTTRMIPIINRTTYSNSRPQPNFPRQLHG